MKNTEKQNSSAGRYARFLNESGQSIRVRLANLGKDMERDKLLNVCRIFAATAALMAIVFAIRTAINFGWI